MVYGRTILLLQIFFFINLPLKIFNFNFIWFFPKKKFWFKCGWTGEKKIYSDLTFWRKKIIPALRQSNYTPAARRGVYCFTSVCLSVRPSFQDIFLSNLIAEIWYLVTSFIQVPHIVGSVFGPVWFLHPVCRLSWFFIHIFLNNYWWQKSGVWSQASYRYPISWEVAGVS